MGFGDSGRRAIYFHGFGEKGNLFSGIWRESITFWGFLGIREQGAEEMRKKNRELGRNFSFREQGAKTLLAGGGGGLSIQLRSQYKTKYNDETAS